MARRTKIAQPTRTQDDGPSVTPDAAPSVAPVQLVALYGIDGPEGRIARHAPFEATPERAADLTGGKAPLARLADPA